MTTRKPRRGKPPLDLTKQRFGRLVAVRRRKDGKWVCDCDCGNETVVFRGALRSGHTQSCGCLLTEVRAQPGHRRATRRSTEKVLRVGNREQTLAEWGEAIGIDVATIRARLARGWSPRRAVREPATSPVTWTELPDERIAELFAITIERVDDGATRHALSLLFQELNSRYLKRHVKKR